ncbi:MAG: DUF3108 domain-containing protein [Tannerellaceae bacterium]|jgi:hypothetical protein|nr:DUF3108 domain-containing protein [Tannerellaceae bacterium]
MKEDKHQAATPSVQECRFKRIITAILILTAFAQGQTQGQGQGQIRCFDDDAVFTDGEKITYDVYFKWGLMTPKAGTASLAVKETKYQGVPAWNTCVLINSSGMVNTFFSIRDTMQNYLTKENLRLLYSGKRTLEGGYYEMDDLAYSYKNDETRIHAIRKNRNRVKTDTVLTGGACVLDLPGSLMYARTFNWENFSAGHKYSLQVSMGKSLINVTYRYEGQRIVERDNVKFRTRLFIVDIYDDAFTETKEAMEIWIGDDDNRIPVKIRAKLKIGAMETYYKSARNLRYPLTCRIKMPE